MNIIAMLQQQASEEYDDPKPLNDAAKIVYADYIAAIEPLVNEGARLSKQLRALEDKLHEAHKQWDRDMREAQPELKNCNWKITSGLAEDDKLWPRERWAYQIEKGSAKPTPQQPEWVREMIANGEV